MHRRASARVCASARGYHPSGTTTDGTPEHAIVRRCHACNFWIPLGGIRDGEYEYCCDECVQDGPVFPLARQLPAADVHLRALKIHGGGCPLCAGRGPVDVRTSYRTWSAVVLTHWSSRRQISCRGCGIRAQFRGIAWSALLGWWGLPLGPLVTPIQIVRNLVAMLVPDTQAPSAALAWQASLLLAQERLAQARGPGRAAHAERCRRPDGPDNPAAASSAPAVLE